MRILFSFLLAFAASLAHAECPPAAAWHQFDVTVQLSLATPPAPDLVVSIAPDVPAQTYSYSSAPLLVHQQDDTAAARSLLYSSLTARGVGCEQLFAAEVIAARHGLQTSRYYLTEADAFWAAYFAPWGRSRAKAFLRPGFASLHLRTAYGTYPAQDIADLLELFGF